MSTVGQCDIAPRPAQPPAVLLVEEDGALRSSLAALLVQSGYLVLTAETTGDARTRRRQSPGEGRAP